VTRAWVGVPRHLQPNATPAGKEPQQRASRALYATASAKQVGGKLIYQTKPTQSVSKFSKAIINRFG